MADRAELPRTSYVPTADCDVVNHYDREGEVTSTTKKEFLNETEAAACAAKKGSDFYVEAKTTKEFLGSEVTSSSGGSRGRTFSSTFYYVSKNSVPAGDRFGGRPEP